MRAGTVVRAIAAIVACAWAMGASGGTNTWTIKGPPGGFFQKMLVSPTDPNTTYAVFNRSLFRSSDAGATWQLLQDVNGQVTGLAVDPADHNRVYLSVLDVGVVRIEVSGEDVNATSITPVFPSPWSVATGNSGTLYYGANDSSFSRSLDRGQSWTQRTSPGPGTTTHILIDPANADIVYIVHNGSRILRSTDGGGSWQNISIAGLDPFATIYSLARLPGSTTLIATTAQSMYVTSDDGANWSVRQAGWFWDVRVDPTQPAGFLAAASSAGGLRRFYRSSDSGTTWSTFGSPPSFGARAIAASGNALIMAGDEGIQRSTDNGATWSEVPTGPATSGPSAMATTLAANSKIYAYTSPGYVGGTGGLFSTSRDSTWERLNIRGAHALASEFGQAALAVKPGDPQTVYLAPFGLGFFTSSDGGTSWVRSGAELNGLGIGALAFDPVDSSTIYATAHQSSLTPSALLYRSTNAGLSWAPWSNATLPTNAFSTSIAVDPADRDRMFVGLSNGFTGAPDSGVYRSIDGGIEWSRSSLSGTSIYDITIDPANPNRIYAVNWAGLQISEDGGSTFVRNTAAATISNQLGRAIVIDPVVPTTLYYASVDDTTPQNESSFILRSVDGGTSWETLRGVHSSVWLVSDLILDPEIPSLIYANTGIRGVAALEISPDLSVRIDGHSGIRPIGFPSTFTLHASNAGPYAATAVRFITTLPAGLTNVSATMDRGSCGVSGNALTCTVPYLRTGETIDAEVTYTTPGAMLLALSTTVSSHERDSNQNDNTATASALAGEVVDLQVSVAAPSTVDRGDTLTYSVTVRNAGPMDATAPSLLFTASSGVVLGTAPTGCTAVSQGISCSIDALALNASRTFSFPATASAIGTLSVTAAAAPKADAADANPANSSVVTTVNSRAVADLAVTATDSADSVAAGTGYEYRITVRNNGPDDVAEILATITVPGSVSTASTTQGTCSSASDLRCDLGTLATGTSATITVSTAVATAGTATLSASITSAGSDRVSGNNSVQESTQITGRSGGSGGGGGGGGGAVSLTLLAALASLLAARRPLQSRAS